MSELFTASSSSSCCTSKEIKTLQEELKSVAWVQCDRLTCLKWRKMKKEDAEKLTDATPWHCSMNKDTDFNACSIEEEDTQQFDSLAKKAKLSVIKSELKPGSLVWAKTSGYCSWPALITEDPANGLYCDGDEIEIMWYHVEYLGGQRCHGWVRGPRVEVFGLGKCPQTSPSKSKPACSSNTKKQKHFQKKRPLTNVTRSHKRERTSYKGQQTLQKAHTEAMTLLPLSCRARLKTCVYTSGRSEKENLQHFVPKAKSNKAKKCKKQASSKNPQTIMRSSLRSKCDETRQSLSNTGLVVQQTIRRSQRRMKEMQFGQSLEMQFGQSGSETLTGKVIKLSASVITRSKTASDSLDMQKNENNAPVIYCDVDKAAEFIHKVDAYDKESGIVDESSNCFNEVIDTAMIEKDSADQLEIRSRLEPFFDFSTTLIDVSKVRRLVADTEKYKAQRLQFESDLSKFFCLHGLSDCKSPTWCQLKISLFEFFITVFERGGYLMVTARHQWSNVYQEITAQLDKDGGSKTKAFYKKNLYPYELYIQGEDYKGALEEIRKKHPARCKTKQKLSTSFNQTYQLTKADNNDLMKELEELDELLQANIEGNSSVNKDPEADYVKENSCSDSHHSSHLLAFEGTQKSHLEFSDDKDKCSQVFPHFSPVKSSKGLIEDLSRKTETDKESLNHIDSQEWTFHELQLVENVF